LAAICCLFQQRRFAVYFSSGDLLAISAAAALPARTCAAWTINLSYMPNVTVTNSTYRYIGPPAVGGAGTMDRTGNITSNPYAPNLLESPDVSLFYALPHDGIYDLANFYTTFSRAANPLPASSIPITASIPTFNVPRSLAGTNGIRWMFVEYVNYAPTTTVGPTVAVSGITSVFVGSFTLNARVRKIYNGPANEVDFSTYLASFRFWTNSTTDIEHEIEVWVEAVNGLLSPRRKVFIAVGP
jgi:hypothetical protein